MSNTEAPTKQRSLRCRLGWHKWTVTSAGFDLDNDHDRGKACTISYICERCPQEKEVTFFHDPDSRFQHVRDESNDLRSRLAATELQRDIYKTKAIKYAKEVRGYRKQNRDQAENIEYLRDEFKDVFSGTYFDPETSPDWMTKEAVKATNRTANRALTLSKCSTKEHIKAM